MYFKDYYITTGIGLGDTFNDYFYNPIWKNLLSFKKNYIGVTEIKSVKLITLGSNPDVSNFFTKYPRIDSIINLPTEGDWKNKFFDTTKGLASLREHHISTPLPGFDYSIEPFCNEEDWKFLLQIPIANLLVRQHPFVFIHPYSSIPEKRIDDKINLPMIIDEIIDKLEMNVVLVGKSGCHPPYDPQIEFLDYERPGLFNFTNGLKEYYNSRIGALLCKRATRHIVSNSAYYQIVKWMPNPHIVLFTDFLQKEYKKRVNMDHWFWYGENHHNVTAFIESEYKEVNSIAILNFLKRSLEC